jgi:ABC-type branched-subunit amino acid transport system ATPase component
MQEGAVAEKQTPGRACAGQNLLDVRGVSKRFGGLVANDAINLSVPCAALVGLIGPNGSGKTTLLNAISGQVPPDAGEILFDQQRLNGLPPAPIARLGLMRTFQQAGVYDGLSCMHNMLASVGRTTERWRDLFGRPDRRTTEKALQCLDFVGLAQRPAQLAGELSYGQRKLLELAMALMSQPRLLLLDEPTAGVSPALVPELVDRLRRVNRELGITVLFIEHNMQVVSELAQQVHCLAQGRLLASGTPEQVRADARVLDAYLGGA